jgi:hypothetical protein
MDSILDVVEQRLIRDISGKTSTNISYVNTRVSVMKASLENYSDYLPCCFSAFNQDACFESQFEPTKPSEVHEIFLSRLRNGRPCPKPEHGNVSSALNLNMAMSVALDI